MADSHARPDPEVVRLSAIMFEHRLKVKDVMALAGLKRLMWYRWRRGGDPRLSEIRAVESAIQALIAEKEAANGTQSREAPEDRPTEPAAG